LKLSLSTGSLYIYPLRTVFRWARSAGFDGVELVVNPEAIVRGGESVRQMAEAEGVEIFSVHPTLVPLPGWRERGGGMGSTFRLAREAGADVVVMHTPRTESLDEGDGLAFLARIESWRSHFAKQGLRLAVENKAIHAEAQRRYALSSLERLRAFADRHDLGLVLDTTHAATAGEDLVHARQIMDGRLVDVHLSDMGGWPSRLPVARVRTMLGEHRFPGSGHLPLPGLLADLAATGYAGPLTLELNPVELRIWWPPAVRRRLARAAVWMNSYVVASVIPA
jgi:sugar phosphate isomerase/epimerase